MKDYSQSKIYGIYYNVWNEEMETIDSYLKYIGSTCETLETRFKFHIKALSQNDKQNRPLYVFMRENGKDNFEIELIENYPCQSKDELRKREGEITLKRGGVGLHRAGTRNTPDVDAGNLLNVYVAGRVIPEADRRRAFYYRNHEEEREKAKVRMAKHYKENTEEVNEKRKTNYSNGFITKKDGTTRKCDEKSKANMRSKLVNESEFTCEHCGEEMKGGAKYRHLNPHKKTGTNVFVSPRCHVLKLKRESAEDKAEREDSEKGKYKCQCGSVLPNTTKDRNRHFKTDKHVKYMEKLEN